MSVPYKNDGMTGMTKAELVEEVAAKTQLTKKHAEIIVNTVFDSIEAGVEDGVVIMRGSINQPYRKSDLEKRVADIPGDGG